MEDSRRIVRDEGVSKNKFIPSSTIRNVTWARKIRTEIEELCYRRKEYNCRGQNQWSKELSWRVMVRRNIVEWGRWISEWVYSKSKEELLASGCEPNGPPLPGLQQYSSVNLHINRGCTLSNWILLRKSDEMSPRAIQWCKISIGKRSKVIWHAKLRTKRRSCCCKCQRIEWKAINSTECEIDDKV